jgi:predicted AlkP superfamily pyrophosphatase or phosphodiesterase
VVEQPHEPTAGLSGDIGKTPSNEPVLPDYDGACITNVVPTLLERAESPPWFPACALEAQRVVLVVLDGLGWEQFEPRRRLAPVLSAMTGGPITTILPTTTAAALTSLTTGSPPGDHGVVGYRMYVHGEVLNVLRWSTAAGDARQAVPPPKVQPLLPFLGHRPPVITRAEFARSGFTTAHLDGVRFTGYRMPSSLVTEVGRLTRSGEPFVYAYYEGIDKVSHEYGIGEHYDAELAAADRLVADLLAVVPRGTAVVVTSDHGQVDVGRNVTPINPEVMAHVSLQSGEGRFRWLHARPGRASALLDAATAAHGRHAWVVTRDDVVNGGWLGPRVSAEAAGRLGDVAIVANVGVAFIEPADTGPFDLVGRHGSATSAEVIVPLLAATT